MSFEKSFCPSPWFHMRINNSGTYEYCRWQVIPPGTQANVSDNIRSTSPLEYFSKGMAPLRKKLLNGELEAGCHHCVVMEQYNKVSGRQRQLLKVGVMEPYFAKSLASSPYKPAFDYSYTNNGITDKTVTDWQIDLGNYCNSACVFCSPVSSSRIATEFVRIGLAKDVPPPAWCNDPVLLKRFCDDLVASPDLRYLHFIGGETLITPGFKAILEHLVNHNVADKITIGFTVNLTVWDDSVIQLLTKFKSVHLGMSIETFTTLNDYVRYPSKIDRAKELIVKWKELGQQHDWFIQLRVTPTCLTIHELITVFDYAWENNLAVESCNFIDEPKALRISVLPTEYRAKIIDHLKTWISNHPTAELEQIVNTRNPTYCHEQIVQDAKSYLAYLESAPDDSDSLGDLVTYLKKLEASRKNSILDYIPQYEELFGSAGY